MSSQKLPDDFLGFLPLEASVWDCREFIEILPKLLSGLSKDLLSADFLHLRA
jgi:hypothetical protein